ncbi:efflux RND transporter permease subunit [Dickeya zeae]|nr:efflux RND transporter permease subunit [Dickeya zeae]
MRLESNLQGFISYWPQFSRTECILRAFLLLHAAVSLLLSKGRLFFEILCKQSLQTFSPLWTQPEQNVFSVAGLDHCLLSGIYGFLFQRNNQVKKVVLAVVPLMVASGASAENQHAIGTGVFGGMISATVLAVFFVPVFFVTVMRIQERYNHWREKRRTTHVNTPH